MLSFEGILEVVTICRIFLCIHGRFLSPPYSGQYCCMIDYISYLQCYCSSYSKVVCWSLVSYILSYRNWLAVLIHYSLCACYNNRTCDFNFQPFPDMTNCWTICDCTFNQTKFNIWLKIALLHPKGNWIIPPISGLFPIKQHIWNRNNRGWRMKFSRDHWKACKCVFFTCKLAPCRKKILTPLVL